MIRIIALYSVKKEKLTPVLKTVKEFVQAVHKHEPSTTYEAYQMADQFSFIHFMSFPDSKAEEKHKNAPYTLTFVKKLYLACQKEPEFIALTKIE